MIDDHDRCEGECFSWYWLTWIVTDKIQRAVKWSCVLLWPDVVEHFSYNTERININQAKWTAYCSLKHVVLTTHPQASPILSALHLHFQQQQLYECMKSRTLKFILLNSSEYEIQSMPKTPATAYCCIQSGLKLDSDEIWGTGKEL